VAVATAPVGLIREAPKAGALLKPLRREILSHARTPVSAAGIAAAMKRPRQVINYHVRELARAGFLKRAGRVRKRGLYEQRYVVSAQAFVLAPEVLGAMDATAATATADKASASYLLMLATRLQRELSESWRRAESDGTPLPLLSIDSELSFASPGDRARFAAALTQAIARIVADHSVAAGRGGDPSTSLRASGRYRLILGCYPTSTHEITK
jgi:hypothetical protein